MAKVSDAQLRANAKYRREKTTQISIAFYPTETDILEHLQSQAKKATYIKNLIRADMEKNGK